jgi:hypothetical protein
MKCLMIKNSHFSEGTLEILVSVVASEDCLNRRLREIKTDLEIYIELILHPGGASSWKRFCAPINRTHRLLAQGTACRGRG